MKYLENDIYTNYETLKLILKVMFTIYQLLLFNTGILTFSSSNCWFIQNEIYGHKEVTWLVGVAQVFIDTPHSFLHPFRTNDEISLPAPIITTFFLLINVSFGVAQALLIFTFLKKSLFLACISLNGISW